MEVEVEVPWMEVEVEVPWMEVEVDAVVPVVVDETVVEVPETLEGVLVELMTLDEVALVEGELVPGEVTTEGVLVVFDKTDNDEVMLDAIGVEEFETKGFVKELAELVGKTAIELLLPKVEKATVDGALGEDGDVELKGSMLWLGTTKVSRLDEPIDIETDETVV